ncbi:phosphoglucosamine mutase [Solirubrobacter sp. CPCC 204708]|uniref:Phosphoglucosamine mutase n=1 Tax=Solirubrobacter deserti TaxID=2282478 RepID=A0ABT4RIP8_9ACTN|nr:phosphoglucosamine mutase [Solirubrobacter deserti]MBE2320222.1 phosphoglucosamine mutase [Solirubrobacter deserti]MDA0138392.1 phosphoglucosamine mutase [Solirubrobacter deserti]
MSAAPTRAARKLFGTDGVRGVAGEFLTAELALALARAATARVQQLEGRAARVLIIRDTRESGEMLEAAVAAGVAAAGGEALIGGILPTPGAPLLIQRHGFDLAAVLSASHNPYQDNGIKFFGGDGYKLSDATEAEIEAALEQPPVVPEHPGRVRQFHGALEDYLRALHERFSGLDLTGRRILLDCANGATFRAAPEIFRRLGADIGIIAHEPDGRNINRDSGSTHLGRLQAAMQTGDDEIGFAFDGDGDRMLAVDRNGVVVDGDELIALAAIHLRDHGRLPGNGVAVTVMTNYGFHTAMEEHGIEVAITSVGDRYVLEALREREWALGGEQSGHIIDRNFVPSGDGIASALLTLEALGTTNLADRSGMEKLPQTLVNVRVRDRDALREASEVHAAVEAESAALEGRGRVLLRPSGTEPLVRVMVEAPSVEEAEAVCGRLVALVQAQLG